MGQVRRGPGQVKYTPKEMAAIGGHVDREAFTLELARMRPGLEAIGEEPDALQMRMLKEFGDKRIEGSETKLFFRFASQITSIAADADEIAIFAAATETFSQKNINCSIEESLARFEPVLAQARARNLPVRGYISCVVGCPYEGDVAPEAVKYVADWMLARGCYEISLGDTIGCGTPQTISALLDRLTADIPAKLLAGHYHDTNGRAIENVMTSINFGLRRFDSAIAGLGGCPFAPGAKGNVSTNALHDALSEAGWHTGLDADRLSDAAEFISRLVTPR